VIGEAVRLREKLKHHQRHIGQHASRDPLIHPVPIPVPIPIPARSAGDTLNLDTLSLEEESCVGSALSEKEVLQ
jgi:hypothetical protein